MRFVTAAIAAVLAVLTVTAVPAIGQTLTTQRVVSGLSLPVFVTAPRGDYNRLFIIEQRSGTTGRIRILNLPGHTLNATPYLSIASLSTDSEEGLLGLAFHPNFLTNGYFFVYYTNAAGNNTIVRYRANAPFATSTTASAASATTLLTISHPTNTNHNGGWMGFSPNDTLGYLYIATGDGGSGNDPLGNAQNVNALLGKMLRLDVDGADNIPGNDDDDGVIGSTLPPYTNPSTNPFAGATAGLDEVYFVGLRNPWRPSFDRGTGDFYIADVGQGSVEEIDFVAAGAAPTPVKNFGWRCMEGTSCTGLSGCTCNATTLTNPVQTYTHAGGACSITGGYVYRGCLNAALRGTYFYADYCSNQIFSFAYSGSGAAPAPTNRTAELAPGGGLSVNNVTSFGEDADGEMYIVDQGGEVFKIIPRSRTVPDCNGNGIDDALEICRGAASDCNNDGVPDTCVNSGPVIAQQPVALTVQVGQPATFTVAASPNGGNALVYQWRRDGIHLSNVAPVSGATSASLTINPAAITDNGDMFDCIVTTSCGSAISSAAMLTVCTSLPCSTCHGACVSDMTDGSGTGPADGGTGIEDLLFYLTVYDSGVPCSDVDDGTGTGTLDGGTGIEDLLYYLTHYDLGC